MSAAQGTQPENRVELLAGLSVHLLTLQNKAVHPHTAPRIPVGSKARDTLKLLRKREQVSLFAGTWWADCIGPQQCSLRWVPVHLCQYSSWPAVSNSDELWGWHSFYGRRQLKYWSCAPQSYCFLICHSHLTDNLHYHKGSPIQESLIVQTTVQLLRTRWLPY